MENTKNLQPFSKIYVALFPIALYRFDNDETTDLHIAQDVASRKIYYGRPLSVSGRPCYILPMFLFIYFFFMAALFSGPG